MVGPVALNDPPWAFTLFTVSKSRRESKSQTTLPSFVEYARRCPSTDPENTTPGIIVAGAICAGLHPALPLQAGSAGAAYQTFSPVAMLSANNPPPGPGTTSESGT